MKTSGYLPTIGIECHVQLKTETKLFAAISNDAREAAPNTLISHICTGMPGALPVLNIGAVKLAARAAYALNTTPEPYSVFERKHYFYPDLPMGYQISQLHQPIIMGGHVDIVVDSDAKRIRINRAQLEADAGKNTHIEGADYSLVDLNRAGTPLLEIVSEPDMHSAAEARAYVRELYLLMKSSGVSDCDLYHGNMRFDVNVSLSKDPKQLGIRSEVKNLNSFRSVEAAIIYEIKRQSELLDKSQPVIQETRGWDEAKQQTQPQRGKEEAHDYRYMPDPDIPPVEIDEAMRQEAQSGLPAHRPQEWRELLTGLQIDASATETLLDSWVDDPQLNFLGLIERSIDAPQQARTTANWAVNIELPLWRENKISNVLSADDRLKLYQAVMSLIEAGKLSSTNAKKLLSSILLAGTLPDDIEAYAKTEGYIQMSDSAAIEKIVDQVLADNPKAAQDVKDGEHKAIGFLVGQIMKQSKGQANPGLAQQLIKQKLGIDG